MSTLFSFWLAWLAAISHQPIHILYAQSSLTIQGTSTLHDWESTVEEYSVSGNITEAGPSQIEVVIAVGSIKSGRSSVMDSKTYDALRLEDHPQIRFQTDQLPMAGNQMRGSGQLTIAGVTRQVTVTGTLTQQSDGTWLAKGKVPLRMTDFGVDPPTAMLGTLKTGDDITINYHLVIKQ